MCNNLNILGLDTTIDKQLAQPVPNMLPLWEDRAEANTGDSYWQTGSAQLTQTVKAELGPTCQQQTENSLPLPAPSLGTQPDGLPPTLRLPLSAPLGPLQLTPPQPYRTIKSPGAEDTRLHNLDGDKGPYTDSLYQT